MDIYSIITFYIVILLKFIIEYFVFHFILYSDFPKQNIQSIIFQILASSQLIPFLKLRTFILNNHIKILFQSILLTLLRPKGIYQQKNAITFLHNLIELLIVQQFLSFTQQLMNTRLQHLHLTFIHDFLLQQYLLQFLNEEFSLTLMGSMMKAYIGFLQFKLIWYFTLQEGLIIYEQEKILLILHFRDKYHVFKSLNQQSFLLLMQFMFTFLIIKVSHR